MYAKKLTRSIIMVGVLALLTGHILYAQEPDLKVAFGTVVENDADQVTISEYDFDTDTSNNVTFIINAQTEFENVDSGMGLKVGDSIDVLFMSDNGQNLANKIIKESYEDDENYDWAEESIEDLDIEEMPMEEYADDLPLDENE